MNFKTRAKYLTHKIKNNIIPRRTTCVFIACLPKSGSTYLSVLLSKLTGFSLSNVMQFAKQNEQDIYEDKMKIIILANSVIQQHVRATEDNVRLLLKYNIKPVILVRNIFDVLMSYYDHIENEDARVPTGFVHKEYLSMTKDERLSFLIKIHLPWFFSFLTSWQEAPQGIDTLWVTYEQLFSNKKAETQKILKFYKINKTDDEIGACVAGINPKKTRFNKGFRGRGGSLSETHKNEILNMAKAWKISADRLKIIGVNL